MTREIPSQSGHILSVNTSSQKGTPKSPVDRIVIGGNGIEGDAHAGAGLRQVSLLSREDIDRFAAAAGQSFEAGQFAENITTCSLDFGRIGVLDKLHTGSAILEVTQLGKACHGDGCAIFREIGECLMPKQGVFCRVITEGAARPGDAVVHKPRPLRLLVVTLSDRANRGEYEDRSGPRARACLEDHFRTTRWHACVEADLMPDDAERLRARLESACAEGVDAVFTTGGTGIGPRDITPDVVLAMAEKTMPGIMEHIRVKYGQRYPNALLSRSVAAVVRETLIFTLPGSENAVGEYMAEILPTLEHALLMLHGLGHR